MTMPAKEDLEWIRRFRKQVAADIPVLCDLASKELGRDPFETLTADLVPLLAACVWTEKNARRVLRPRRVRGASIWQLGQRHRVVRAPLGRIGIIATWNYPLQLMGIQLVQAIACGNSVVVKPSERTPLIQGAMLRIARAAGLGEQRLRWTDADRHAGAAMLRDEHFDHVVFTGSTKIGLQIAQSLSKSLTPSTLELSGCDSAIVLSDADPRLAARSIGFALTLNAGQTCMAPRRVLVTKQLAGQFLAELERFLRGCSLTTRLDPNSARAASEAIAAAEHAGAVRVVGDPDADEWPVVVSDCPPACGLARDEHFAPVLAMIPTDSDEESFRIHDGIRQRLATSVFVGRRGVEGGIALKAGSTVVTINDCVIPTGHPGVSIGGIGPSGWGVSRGELGLLSMSRPVFVSRTSARLRTPLDPPTPLVRAKTESFVRWWYS